jgi:hypothetical protein
MDIHRKTLILVTLGLMALSSLPVLVRVYFRKRNKLFKLDDWLIITALVSIHCYVSRTTPWLIHTDFRYVC